MSHTQITDEMVFDDDDDGDFRLDQVSVLVPVPSLLLNSENRGANK